MFLKGIKESFTSKKTKVANNEAMVKNGVLEGSWDYEYNDFPNYSHGMTLLPRHKITESDWILGSFHGWYMKACSRGIQFIQDKVPREHFNCEPFDLHVSFEDMHALYHFDRMDATMLTIWCL
jgi:hypothetical protein